MATRKKAAEGQNVESSDPNEIMEGDAVEVQPEVQTEDEPKVQPEDEPKVEEKVNDVVSHLKVNEELRYTLEKYPHIDCVWVDENGNWLFCERPGFTAYSREQILNG